MSVMPTMLNYVEVILARVKTCCLGVYWNTVCELCAVNTVLVILIALFQFLLSFACLLSVSPAVYLPFTINIRMIVIVVVVFFIYFFQLKMYRHASCCFVYVNCLHIV